MPCFFNIISRRSLYTDPHWTIFFRPYRPAIETWIYSVHQRPHWWDSSVVSSKVVGPNSEVGWFIF
jgi:hypothetical protein